MSARRMSAGIGFGACERAGEDAVTEVAMPPPTYGWLTIFTPGGWLPNLSPAFSESPPKCRHNRSATPSLAGRLCRRALSVRGRLPQVGG